MHTIIRATSAGLNSNSLLCAYSKVRTLQYLGNVHGINCSTTAMGNFLCTHCVKEMSFYDLNILLFRTNVHFIESDKLSPVIGVNMSVILPGHEFFSAVW